ncbi:MAG: bifunctional heptose 7-phosphate kinase/heptose 1-phosphate adenyltransferase, partial [Bacteroidetes bacterium]|nr:bifunctional heptose 7-phosphate kinase/heptose 1-phosphate adenyltransferase [Bacteroidota bacterium]
GKKLVVGLNSDSSVKNLKGEDKPYNDQETRAVMLASLYVVDAVIIFNEETPQQLLEWIKPDVLVKGGDYTKEEVVGSELVEGYGGKVEIIGLLEGYSTTELASRISGQ